MTGARQARPGAPSAEAPQIVLIGLRGAGKSAVGEALAERLDCPFIDTDRWVEAQLQTSIRALFDAGQEARFRQAEEEALSATLRERPAVIATGGGIIERASNRARLREVFTVWLQAPPDTLAERCAGSDRPPLVETAAQGEAPELVEARVMLERRWRHYEACSTLSVATERSSIDEVCDLIEEAWRRSSSPEGG